MVLPVFVGCFNGRAHDGEGVYQVYLRSTQLLGSAILFFFANVLKTLLAKMMSTHFHKEAHFKKMQVGLQKVPPPPPRHPLTLHPSISKFSILLKVDNHQA
jgi:hypothetical protein